MPCVRAAAAALRDPDLVASVVIRDDLGRWLTGPYRLTARACGVEYEIIETMGLS